MLDNVNCGGLVFSAAFDSGNASRVEAVSDDEFALWTARDCEGTPFETGCRTWFSFSVRGATPGRTLAFQIRNMNSQGNLYRQDMRPVYRALPSAPFWDRIPLAATHTGGKCADKYREMRENRDYVSGGQAEFVLRFEHTVECSAEDTLYFAFCFPVSRCSLARCQWPPTTHQ